MGGQRRGRRREGWGGEHGRVAGPPLVVALNVGRRRMDGWKTGARGQITAMG